MRRYRFAAYKRQCLEAIRASFAVFASASSVIIFLAVRHLIKCPSLGICREGGSAFTDKGALYS